VIATDVNLAGLDGTVGCETRALDVTDGAAVAALAAELGAVDVLFNCAGYVHVGTILDCDEAAWDFSFNLNAKAMYRMIRAFLPAMLEAGGGSIVNVASVASSVTGVPGRFAYGGWKPAGFDQGGRPISWGRASAATHRARHGGNAQPVAAPARHGRFRGGPQGLYRAPAYGSPGSG
jgi:NAD(P)-dependent dehydrogenase (short-subunit alcohol dehydrogenase family)